MSDQKPKKSVKREIQSGQSRTFSSFDDLANWAVATKQAPSAEEVRAVPSELWGSLLFEWFAQGQIACMFAISLAAQHLDKIAWFNARMPEDGWNAEMVTDVVDGFAASGAEAIQLIFPGAGDAAHASSVISELLKSDRWMCADVGRMNEEPNCESRQVGLRWISPDRSYESWVLGIADYPEQPFTRRFCGAPFLALVVRPTPPVTARAPAVVGETGLPAAHLAHLDDALGEDQQKRDKWTVHTRTAKRLLIAPDPLSRARARVTFAFSAADFERLESLATIKAYQPPVDAAK